MNIDPYTFSIVTSAGCGVLMVAGAIWLLKTGVIKLNEAAKDGALSIDVASKVKISTTYPALALFVIGLAFVATAIWFSRPNPGIPLKIVGQIDIDDPNLVTVNVQPDITATFKPDSDGRLDRMLSLEVRQLNVTINAAGYKPAPFTATLNTTDVKEHRLALERPIRFEKLPISTPAPGEVVELPKNAKIEPLTKPN